ncbi:ATP-binding protein [Kutzneria chonburiensis]|uniref:AAA family ATPase n=1 Tax=Kutzneria chonburiensis TaxID=1483604 RepID=A0ABV6MQD1_9PSEU|nr:AAA family ATPase [Kutzneria chonburiensis]
MARVFVGRREESTEMQNFLERVARSGTRILLVEGPAGVGKSALVSKFRTYFRESWSGRPGVTALVRCHGQVGADNAYEPMVDAVEQLNPQARRWRRAKAGAHVAAASASELVAGVVPGTGPALRAGVGALGHSRLADGARSVQGLTSAVLAAVGREHVGMLVVDDAHLIDASSCQVVERLVSAPERGPLAIVLAVRPEEVDGALREMLGRLTVRGQVDRLVLSGLGVADIAEYVRLSIGAVPAAKDCDRLRRVTGGLPFFLGQCMSLLQEEGHGIEAPVPCSVELVIRLRLGRLNEQVVTLLVHAAVQGERFSTDVLERMANVPHDEVLTQLYSTAAHPGLIHLCPPDERARVTGYDVYEFDHSLLHSVLYAWQSPQQRRERHALAARVLLELSSATDTTNVEFQLELVRHHHLGGDFGPAARRALAVARTLLITGGSLGEAERLCRQALADARSLPSDQETDRLEVEIIELLLLCTEPRWHVVPGAHPSTELEGLVDEAVQAAARNGDLLLQVRVAAVRGRVVHRVHGVDAGLEAQRQAVELASAAGPVVRFLTLAMYGRELTKRDMYAGIEVLRQAERLAEQTPEIHDSTDVAMRQAYFRTKVQIGVNLFDAGQLGAANTVLDAMADRLRRTEDVGILPIGLNFLAQVQLAIGSWAAARATLHDAVRLADDGPDAWHANNLALLGKLRVDQGEVEAGLAQIEAAWVEMKQVWQTNLATLVANLYAQAVLDSSPGKVDRPALVDRLLTDNISECRLSGMTRSEVLAHCLHARLRLAMGGVDDAYEASQRAVRLLEKHDPLPALRTEEIYYWHSEVLRQLGRGTEADEFRRRAGEIVRTKAQSLDGVLRERFLTEVPLNVLVTHSA